MNRVRASQRDSIKTVITEVGPVDLDVARVRGGPFEPQTVKRERRLDGVDSMVLSLTARGSTTGEAEVHLMEVYSTEISREPISKITDRVLDEIADWYNTTVNAQGQRVRSTQLVEVADDVDGQM